MSPARLGTGILEITHPRMGHGRAPARAGNRPPARGARTTTFARPRPREVAHARVETADTVKCPAEVQEVGSGSDTGMPCAAWRAERALLKRVRSVQNASRSSGAQSCVSSAIN